MIVTVLPHPEISLENGGLTHEHNLFILLYNRELGLYYN